MVINLIMVINLKYRKWVKLIILFSPMHVPPISSVAIFKPFGVAQPLWGET